MANFDFRALWEAYNAERDAGVVEFHAPRGNSKLGQIPAWNMLPGVTCSAGACEYCMKDGCYTVKNCFRAGYSLKHNNVLKSWADNTVMAIKHPRLLEQKLDEWLTNHQPRFFRIHSAGDFFSVPYARMWVRLAKKHPDTKFLAFTKQWNVVRAVPFHKVKNLELVLSGWTGVEIPEDLRQHYRCAWCEDGVENRIPKNAMECPGDCTHCGLCWHLSSLGRDTVFHKH